MGDEQAVEQVPLGLGRLQDASFVAFPGRCQAELGSLAHKRGGKALLLGPGRGPSSRSRGGVHADEPAVGLVVAAFGLQSDIQRLGQVERLVIGELAQAVDAEQGQGHGRLRDQVLHLQAAVGDAADLVGRHHPRGLVHGQDRPDHLVPVQNRPLLGQHPQGPAVGGHHLVHRVEPEGGELRQAFGDRLADALGHTGAAKTGPGGGLTGLVQPLAAGEKD